MVYEHRKNNLSADGRAIYGKMLAAFSRQAQSVELLNPVQHEIQCAFSAVFYDHPELFWLSHAPSASGSGGPFGVKVLFQCKSIYSSGEIRQFQATIENIKNSLKPLLSACRNDFEKEKTVCDYLLRSVDYEIDNTYNQNAAAALVKRKAQCSGISKAVKLLFDWIGIDCLLVEGEIDDQASGTQGPHAWNMVCINNVWYHLDVTLMLGANTAKTEPFRYMYFNYADAETRQNHVWRQRDYPQCPTKYTGDPSAMPTTPQTGAQSAPSQAPTPSRPSTPAPTPSYNGRRAWGAPRQVPAPQPVPASAPAPTPQPQRRGFPFFGNKNAGNNPSTPTRPQTPTQTQPTKQAPVRRNGPTVRTVAEFKREIAKVYAVKGNKFECCSKINAQDAQTLLNMVLQAASDEASANGIRAELTASIRDGEAVTVEIKYLPPKPAQRVPAPASAPSNTPSPRKNLPVFRTVEQYRQAVARIIAAQGTKLQFYMESPLKDTPQIVNELLQNAGQEIRKSGRGARLNVSVQGDEVTLEIGWQ